MDEFNKHRDRLIRRAAWPPLGTKRKREIQLREFTTAMIRGDSARCSELMATK